AENSLLEKAIDNARQKADVMAAKSNLKIKGVISVIEGSQQGSVYPLGVPMGMGAGGGAPVEPGSSNIQKKVTVVFETD
ncbi:MAG: SIMPL domain-containing protein, partial [bacterium]|nr:SIMPL domain-containing protein [bacterium]